MRPIEKDENVFNFNISKYIIKHDIYDEKIFEEIKDSSPKLQETAKKLTTIYPQYNELSQDIFNAFYKYYLKLYDEKEIDYNYLLNYHILKEIFESNKYKEIRSISRLDKFISSMGVEVIADDVMNLIKKLANNFKKIQKKYKQLENLSDNTNTSKNTKSKKSNIPMPQQPQKNKKISYDEAKKLLEKYKNEVKKLITPEIKVDIHNTLSKLKDSIGEMTSCISNWGLGGNSCSYNINYQDKVFLFKKLRESPKLKAISENIGRFINFAVSTQQEKISEGLNEIYDIVPKADIQKILPSELIYFGDPITELLFYKNLTEGNVLSLHYDDKQVKKRGPMVVCIDTSGSMAEDAEIWSKSVAMGLLEIAKLQKRSFCAIHFSSGVHSKDLHKNWFPADKPKDIKDVIDMLEYFECGGTEFEPPLDAAQSIISLEKDFTKADIVFITDGEAAVRDKWLNKFIEWKKENNVKVYSILIDIYYHSNICLKQFSDKIYNLNNIKRDVITNEIGDLYASI